VDNPPSYGQESPPFLLLGHQKFAARKKGSCMWERSAGAHVRLLCERKRGFSEGEEVVALV